MPTVILQCPSYLVLLSLVLSCVMIVLVVVVFESKTFPGSETVCSFNEIIREPGSLLGPDTSVDTFIISLATQSNHSLLTQLSVMFFSLYSYNTFLPLH